MGTRHLISVKVGGETKVAQYGQWDGYPTGQGVDVLKFLKNKKRQELLKEKCQSLRWGTGEEFDEVDKIKDWPKKYPYLSRDCGSDILTHIIKDEVKFLSDSSDFLNDTVSCEWGYCIDFDRNVLQIFMGGPNLAIEYQLNKLPSQKKFLNDFSGDYEEIEKRMQRIKKLKEL
jgi:hypothetical protein